MYKLIDGKVISKQIKDELKEKVAGLKADWAYQTVYDYRRKRKPLCGY